MGEQLIFYLWADEVASCSSKTLPVLAACSAKQVIWGIHKSGCVFGFLPLLFRYCAHFAGA